MLALLEVEHCIVQMLRLHVPYTKQDNKYREKKSIMLFHAVGYHCCRVVKER